MSNIHSCKTIKMNTIEDDRGFLTSIESSFDIPIEIKRIFYMHSIKADRGGHAHIETDQILICLNGKFKVKITDAFEEKIFELNEPKIGLYIPRLLFTNLYDFSESAICLVMANTHYNFKKSLRTWDDYKNYISNGENS